MSAACAFRCLDTNVRTYERPTRAALRERASAQPSTGSEERRSRCSDGVPWVFEIRCSLSQKYGPVQRSRQAVPTPVAHAAVAPGLTPFPWPAAWVSRCGRCPVISRLSLLLPPHLSPWTPKPELSGTRRRHVAMGVAVAWRQGDQYRQVHSTAHLLEGGESRRTRTPPRRPDRPTTRTHPYPLGRQPPAHLRLTTQPGEPARSQHEPRASGIGPRASGLGPET